MSPEQAKGRRVDKRADIWAFGCVLYEMLTGRRAFDGEEVTEILASVIKSEPAWDALPASVPLRVRQLLKHCLEKDPQHRMRDIWDVRLVLDGIFDVPAAPAAATPIRAQLRVWQRPLALVGMAIILMLGTALGVWTARRPVPPAVTRVTVALPPGDRFAEAPSIALSPDGRTLAYVAIRQGVRQIQVRRLDELQATTIPGTEGGNHPFFSPDGRWIGYVVGGQLKKVPLRGRRGAHNYRGARRPAPRILLELG